MTYTEPLLSILLIVCVCMWAGLRANGKKTVLGLGILGFFLLSWPPAQWLFSRPLESRYPIGPFQTTLRPEAIVAVGGGIAPPLYERPYPLADRDTFEHCAMAAWIYRTQGPLPVLGCEGSHGKRAFPSVMRELFRNEGVPDDLIWIDDRSRNTHENAVYGAAILRQHGIRRVVLVTDAQSMPRAAACFRKQGIDIIPAPSEFSELEFSRDGLIPSWKAIRDNERTLHELLGLAWYSIRGWI